MSWLSDFSRINMNHFAVLHYLLLNFLLLTEPASSEKQSRYIAKLSVSTPTCRNADNSTNLIVSCTFVCGSSGEEAPAIKMFGTFDLKEHFNQYSKKTLDGYGNELSDSYICMSSGENITVEISGAVSEDLRNHQCLVTAECQENSYDSKVFLNETFQYQDCSIDETCNVIPTSSSSFSSIISYPTSPVVTTSTVSVTITVDSSPVDCSDHFDSEYILMSPSTPAQCSCVSDASLEKQIETTAITANQPQTGCDQQTPTACSTSPTFVNAVSLGASNGVALLLIIISMTFNIVMFCSIIILRKRSANKSQSLSVSNPQCIKNNEFEGIPTPISPNNATEDNFLY